MEVKQYSVRKILGLWALVALPMVFFRFVLMPVLVPIVSIHPGILYWMLMIAGMIWQFILSVIILRRELGKWSWEKLKKRLWLNHPVHPKSFKVYKLAYKLDRKFGDPKFEGAWYLLGIALVSCLFNYLLGEELFFRGILLLQMKGAFGKWDWVMNGVLFASYHLHKISEIPLFIVGSLSQ